MTSGVTGPMRCEPSRTKGSFPSHDQALYDQTQELRIANDEEWFAISDAANDFLHAYGLNWD